MIPAKKDTRVESTLTGEDVAMTLDPNAARHLMNVMTDLYANPELAALREYATNAYDSHVEAGVEDPIEVELPTALRPTLVIRDHGVGLSAEDIRTIYSRYGASTKRSTNELSGVLGLGCKSALTYTDQFTIRAVKDGMVTVVSVSREDDGGGVMKILSEEETTDRNGVEVTIPCPRDNELEETAANLFRFWQPGTVLVNGKQPDYLPEAGVKVTDTIYAFPKWRYGNSRERALMADWIVMGNVPYETDLELPGARLVAFVDIGAVDFAPSRESLQDTRRTRETQAAIKASYKAEVSGAAQRMIDAAPDRAAALQAWVDSSFLGSQGVCRWRDEDVPATFTSSENRLFVLSKRGYYGGEGAHSTAKEVGPAQAAGVLWVTDYTNTAWSAQQRRKLDAYLEKFHEGLTADNAILTPDAAVPHKDWITPSRVVSWLDVRKWKPDGGGVQTGSKPWLSTSGTYPAYLSTGRWVKKHPVSEFDAEKPLLYVVGRMGWHSQFADVVRELFPGLDLAEVNQTRLAKFKRTFPFAVEAREAVAQAAEAWWANLTDRERHLAIWSPDYNDSHRFDNLILDKVEDPDIRAYAALVQEALEPEARERRALRSKVLRHVGYETCEVDPDEFQMPVAPDIDSRYPLLTCVNRYNVNEEHLTLYVNAAYRAAQEEEDH